MKELYNALNQAMIEKDKETLQTILHESFQIIHVNGLIQTKEEYINEIVKGTMNYYSFQEKKYKEEQLDEKRMLIEFGAVLCADLYQSGKREWPIYEKIAVVNNQIYRILVANYR